MKRPRLNELRGVLGIVLPGAVAAFVVARTLAAYWDRDWLACSIVFAIGTALALGLSELFARVARAAQLERELRALPATPTQSTLDTASPLLGSLLRARLEQAPLPNLSEGSASFITGLLVMLGLLGTLLGLFKTVHGAGQALTSSNDIEALRSSLSAPIEGLTRSFGCSAAGISASAMLGLAIALVRRCEVRAMRAFYAYACGPLRVLSPAHRQLHAIEQLARQGSALPEAAVAIERVGAKLGELSGQLALLQQTAHQAQQRAFSDMLAGVRGEFSQAAGEIGEALHARVSPLLEQMATRSGEALIAQAGALADVARDMTRELERDATTRRQEASETLQALREASRSQEHERLENLAALTRETRERHAENLAGLAGLTTKVSTELERLSGALSTQLEQRLASERNHDERAERVLLKLTAAASALQQGSVLQNEALAQSSRLLDAAIARQSNALEVLIARVAELLPQLADAAQSGAASTLARLQESAEAQAARFSEFEATLSRGREQHALELAEQLSSHAAELEQRLTRTSDAVQEAAALWQASSAEMQAVAELFANSVERQRQASEAWLESLGEIDGAVEHAGRHAARDALADQLASTQEVFARQLQFQRELFDELRALRAGQSRGATGEQDVSV
jgi:hypothetical protein